MTTAPAPTSGAAPATLELAHRRYLLLEQGVGSAIFNLLLNGAIAYLTARSLERVPLWSSAAGISIAGDTIATTFLLPFFTCLIVTRLARGQVTSGRLPPVAWRRDGHAALKRLPARTLPRALVLGTATLVAVAPVAVWALTALAVNDLGRSSFIVFKALFAAALAAVITPLVALGALGDTAPAPAAGAKPAA